MKMIDTSKPVVKRIFFFLCGAVLSLALQAGTVYAKPESLDRIVVVINNDVIMKSELDFRLKQVEYQLHHKKIDPPPLPVLQKQVLERMIIENLQLHEAKRQGVHISDQILNDEMKQMAQRNHMSFDAFRNSLKSQGLDYEQVRTQIRNEMMIAQVQQLDVLQHIHVTQQDVDNYLSSPEAKKHLVYNLAHILVSVPDNASPDDIGAARHKADRIHEELSKKPENFGSVAIRESQGQFALNGGDLGWRSTEELPDIFIRIADTLKSGEISRVFKDSGGFHILKLNGTKGTEKHFETFYHVRHILVKPDEIRSDKQTHQLALEIYQDLEKDGKSFPSLAKKYSDDKNSSLDGGNLGWITPDRLVPAFAKKIKTMETGTYSKPFHTEYGWHIVEVLGKRKEDISQKKQQEQVREILIRRKFEEELPIWVRQLKNDAYIKEML